MKINIVGAGLAGLLAASHFPDARIYERRGPHGFKPHKALLRFRSPDIGDHLGIPFKKVRVDKGIYYNGNMREPNIMLCNMYSRKVTGAIGNRSIWNTESVHRWIAPDDLHERLLDRFNNRIDWSCNFDLEDWILKRKEDDRLISTMPLNVPYKRLDTPMIMRPIYVERYKLCIDCDVYQTVYFPDPMKSLYRASLSGRILIVEYMHASNFYNGNEFNDVIEAFGLEGVEMDLIENAIQANGKLRPIDDELRKQLIHSLTVKSGVFSLGRFAIWKNVLLDDVFHDVQVIKKLINSSDYELSKKALAF